MNSFFSRNNKILLVVRVKNEISTSFCQINVKFKVGEQGSER